MARFSDAQGRDWSVSVTVGALPDLRDAGLDLSDPRAAFDRLAEAAGDPFKFGALLWVLCGEQALSRGVDEREFARGFDGEALARAEDALLEAVSDFTLRRPALARAARARLKRLTQEMEERQVTALEGPEPPTPTGSNGRAGASPASAGSTPGG